MHISSSPYPFHNTVLPPLAETLVLSWTSDRPLKTYNSSRSKYKKFCVGLLKAFKTLTWLNKLTLTSNYENKKPTNRWARRNATPLNLITLPIFFTQEILRRLKLHHLVQKMAAKTIDLAPCHSNSTQSRRIRHFRPFFRTSRVPTGSSWWRHIWCSCRLGRRAMLNSGRIIWLCQSDTFHVLLRSI